MQISIADSLQEEVSANLEESLLDLLSPPTPVADWPCA
jgi:hypothetical protein